MMSQATGEEILHTTKSRTTFTGKVSIEMWTGLFNPVSGVKSIIIHWYSDHGYQTLEDKRYARVPGADNR